MPQRTRTTRALRKDIDKLNEDIDLEAVLQRDLEQKYMEILEGLILGKVKSVGT